MATLSFDGSQQWTPVGYFTYQVAEDSWWWSPGVYELHGFAPGEVPATTGVLLSHKHPDDRARTFEVLENAADTGETFSCYHRIIDRDKRVRSVLSVGRGVTDEDGTVTHVDGYFVDMTEIRRVETNAEVEVALARIAETRAVIDQAKGMLRLATGCDADEAFELLRRASQNANVKLRDVAHLVVDAIGPEVKASDETREAVLTLLEGLR